MNPYQVCVQQDPRPRPVWSFLGGGSLHSPGGGEGCHRLACGTALNPGGRTWSSHTRGWEHTLLGLTFVKTLIYNSHVSYTGQVSLLAIQLSLFKQLFRASTSYFYWHTHIPIQDSPLLTVTSFALAVMYPLIYLASRVSVCAGCYFNHNLVNKTKNFTLLYVKCPEIM